MGMYVREGEKVRRSERREERQGRGGDRRRQGASPPPHQKSKPSPPLLLVPSKNKKQGKQRSLSKRQRQACKWKVCGKACRKQGKAAKAWLQSKKQSMVVLFTIHMVAQCCTQNEKD